MDKITSGKILVGSSLKGINYAKTYGKLKFKELYLFNLISQLNSFCELNKSFAVSQKLDKILRALQNKYPTICNYRSRGNDSTFITGKPVKDLNTITDTNTKPTVLGYNCYDYEYTEFSIPLETVLSGYSDSENNSAKYIRIKSIPLLGSLEYNNVPVIINQIVLLEDIDNLKYDLNLVYSDVVNVTFTYQIGDDSLNTLFSNEVTYNICVPEKHNLPPTVEDEQGELDSTNCRTFIYGDFTNNFTDPNEGDVPFEVEVLTLPSIGELEFNGSVITAPFIFDISEVNQLKFCLPDDFSVINGVIYSYTGVLNELLNECFDDGYVIESVVDGTYNLTKTEQVSITNTTNIYAFFDTTSMQQQDGVDAKIALETWFNGFKIDNSDFTGNLYVIPTGNERWVQYGITPWTGVISFVNTFGQWGNIAQLPINLNTPEWISDPDAVVLSFVDESNFDYHSSSVSDGFTGVITQPTLAYTGDFISFKDVYSNYNFFRGLIYPVVQSLTGNGGALVLQAMAAIEGTTLTQAEISTYNTQVDVSLLLTTNAYENHLISSNPDIFLEPLKDYNWGGQFDKTSPASEVFNSTTFSNDLDEFLSGSMETIVTTKQIVGTLVTDQPIDFTFRTSDDDNLEQLFSNTATYTLTYGNLNNLPPVQVGDGSKTINNSTVITFNRNDFTNNLNPSYLDPENDPAFKLKIISLPSQGTLTLNSINVIIDQEILFTDIDSGLFQFTPNPNLDNYSVEFDFQVSDSGSNEFVG